MAHDCILIDTSFFIRLLNDRDPLHQNAMSYYKYFLQNQVILKTSTISVAEYCVKGRIDQLPLKDLQIIPFNINHAVRTGEFARIVFEEKSILSLPDRRIIPNDTKLFAQADMDEQVQKFATSDVECIKIFNLLKEKAKLRFEIINIRNPYDETFGVLDLK
ncbi:MAG: hypothetical protein HY842_16085 [Bacteroidetes bacterium]|nr:hypothetical protein [Bacteroidota bacterium]